MTQTQIFSNFKYWEKYCCYCVTWCDRSSKNEQLHVTAWPCVVWLKSETLSYNTACDCTWSKSYYYYGVWPKIPLYMVLVGINISDPHIFSPRATFFKGFLQGTASASFILKRNNELQCTRLDKKWSDSNISLFDCFCHHRLQDTQAS